MWETILDPETIKLACGVAAMIYGIATVTLLIAAIIANTSSLRNDSRIVAPILAIIAISLALVDAGFPRASQTLLPILYPGVGLTLAVSGVALIILAIRILKHRATRIVAVVAAVLPMATSVVLLLIALVLAHSRFCC
ncbi:MAG: hypothetical protein WA431_12975 [Candidatus Cybelea sp.]